MTSKFKKITKLDEFKKDFKKLNKRFPSLEEDLNTFINIMLFSHHKRAIKIGGIFPINNLGFDSPKIYKVKRFACKSLKGKGGRSGIRIIYTYLPISDEILLIEIYYKSDKENENRERIKKLYPK